MLPQWFPIKMICYKAKYSSMFFMILLPNFEIVKMIQNMINAGFKKLKRKGKGK